MNDYFKAGVVIFTIILLFVLSYVATDHLDKTQILESNETINKLETQNDSLRTLISTLTDSVEATNE